MNGRRIINCNLLSSLDVFSPLSMTDFFLLSNVLQPINFYASGGSNIAVIAMQCVILYCLNKVKQIQLKS